MDKPDKKTNDYVIEGILAKPGYGITTVNNIETIQDLYFVREEYAAILACIKTGNLDLIQQPDKKVEGFGEYLSIMRFASQDGKEYITTIYDNDELWQDPEVMDIVSVG